MAREQVGSVPLTAPLASEAFASTVWDRRPLRLASDRRMAERLGGVAALDRLLCSRTTVFPMVRCVVGNETLPPVHYCHAARRWGVGQVPGVIRPEMLFRQVRSGHTLVVEALELLDDDALALAHRTMAWAWCPTTINAYLTPAGGRAFGPHWDTQGVVVMQLAGRKRWWVHGPARSLPLPTEPCPRAGVDTPGPVVLETVLEPGDRLFIPRGFVHHAAALDAASLHWSLSITPRTVHELLQAAVETPVPPAPSHRASLPFRAHPAPDDLPAALAGVAPAADLVEAWSGLHDALVRDSRACPAGGLTELCAPGGPLGPESRVVPMPQLVRVRATSAGCCVVVPGVRLDFPAFAHAALSALFGSDPPCLGALPGLGVDEGVELGQHLLREGVVVRQERARPGRERGGGLGEAGSPG